MKHLIIENYNVTNLNSIGNLQSLYYLSLTNLGLDNISVVSNLKELDSLIVENNKIEDITPIRGLNKLSFIKMNNNEIKDITPLKDMVSLSNIKMDDNEIKDITPLGNLKKLSTLHMDNNKIEDISSLNNLINIEDVELMNNKISYISSVDVLFRSVKLSGNNIFDFSKLRYKYVLRDYDSVGFKYNDDLDLTNQEVTMEVDNDNNGIIEIPLPKTINKNKPKVSDISDGGVYDEESNTVKWTNISGDADISFKMNYEEKIYHEFGTHRDDPGFYLNHYFKYAGNVKVHVNRVKGSEEVIREAALKSLGKAENEPLTQEDIEKVTSLDLSNSKLKSIEEIKPFKNLQTLKLNNNKISDISPLAELKNLSELNLSNNKISESEITTLSQLKNLSVLDLSYNSIYDLRSLKCLNELTNLKSLNLERQQMCIVETNKSYIEFEPPYIDEDGQRILDFATVNGCIYIYYGIVNCWDYYDVVGPCEAYCRRTLKINGLDVKFTGYIIVEFKLDK